MSLTKICSSCNKESDKNCFYRCAASADGLRVLMWLGV